MCTAIGASFAGNLGSRAEIAPKNLIDPGRFVLKTPDVVIRVADGKEDLVAVKSIDGAKYILIRADTGVELNGLPLRVDGEDGE